MYILFSSIFNIYISNTVTARVQRKTHELVDDIYRLLNVDRYI